MITLSICHAILASKAAPQDLKKVNITYRFKLAPAPSPFPTSQAYYNASTWSWGGSIIHVPEDRDGFQFHLFAEAEVGGCGVHAWQTNARVIHARAKNPEGPYEWHDNPVPGVWRAGPDISRASDGTFLLWTMASNATAVHCVDGVGNYSCPPDPHTGRKPRPGYPCVHNGLFRNRLYASQSVYGPWQEVHNSSGGDAIPASINANSVAHPLANGTVIVIGGGIYIAQHWTGPYVRQKRGINFTGVNKQYWENCPKDPRNAAYPRWPDAVCALEDEFFWFDAGRGRWRWMAHQKLKGAGGRSLRQCDYFPGVGGFAESESENFWGPWSYDFWVPAYGLNTRLTNGTHYCLTSRERPKILVLRDGSNRTFLTNSACPTHMGPGDSRCFTFVQEVLSS